MLARAFGCGRAWWPPPLTACAASGEWAWVDWHLGWHRTTSGDEQAAWMCWMPPRSAWSEARSP
eukprot:8809825-Prorocentrum_lima.AAC.1